VALFDLEYDHGHAPIIRLIEARFAV
jgi:hypothetical protein